MSPELSLSHKRAIIVGAGQSGLAVAAALIEQGLIPQDNFAVIDAGDGVRSWSNRWHSLMLLSEARHSALHGRPFPGDQRRHPYAYEFSSYLTEVESWLGVKPLWGIEALKVDKHKHGTTLNLGTSIGEVQTRNIVCATGAAALPHIPSWAMDLSLAGAVLHSSQYLYPSQIPPGNVLIVGGGNAGVQIARELTKTHTVTLSVRSRRTHQPARMFARWNRGTIMSQRDRGTQPLFTDSYERLQRSGVALCAAVAGIEGTAAMLLADGSRVIPDSVILATGYLPADNWLPHSAQRSPVGHARTTVPGLFVAGMPRYGSRESDTIRGIWRDARTIARHILDRP